MFQKILVSVDGSELSESAIPLAVAIAQATGGSLILATVEGDTGATPESDRDGPPVAGVAEGYLKHLAARMGPGGIPVRTITTVGDPASELHRIVVDENIDLLVIASRGHSGLVRSLLGSVTDRLIHACDIPVLVVRPETAVPFGESFEGPRCVIVPLDGSEMSEQALEPALMLSKACSAYIILVRCVRYPTAYAYAVPDAMATGSVIGMRELEEEAASQLERVAARLRDAQLPDEEVRIDTRVMAGHPRTRISDLAAELPGSMILLTSHGAAGIVRWVMGSVADGLIRTAPVPTMVIPMRPPAVS